MEDVTVYYLHWQKSSAKDEGFQIFIVTQDFLDIIN